MTMDQAAAQQVKQWNPQQESLGTTDTHWCWQHSALPLPHGGKLATPPPSHEGKGYISQLQITRITNRFESDSGNGNESSFVPKLNVLIGHGPSPRPTTADNCHTASIPIHNSLGSEHDAHFMIAIYFYHVAAEYIRIK